MTQTENHEQRIKLLEQAVIELARDLHALKAKEQDNGKERP